MHRIWVDSSSYVEVAPEYNYVERAQRLGARHRTLSGAEYAYRFGQLDRLKFSASLVDSASFAQIVEWWLSNTPVYFGRVGDPQQFRMRITNAAVPLAGYFKPNKRLREGDIEMEQYLKGGACVVRDWPVGDYGSIADSVSSSYDAGSIADPADNCPIDWGSVA